nr:uncharacterized protein LOC117275111 [Nicotiana tomentosiformis]
MTGNLNPPMVQNLPVNGENHAYNNVVPVENGYRVNNLAGHCQITARNYQVNFPKFDGYGLKDWLYSCEQFFDVDETLEDAKVKLASSKSKNKVIIQNLKKRLEAAKGNWPEELPRVLWAYRTTAKSSTGENLFSLVYGAEALIPIEVREPTLRYFQADEESNNEAILVNSELLDERRDLAHIRMAAQKQRIERYYNRRANLYYFKVGYLVLRKVTQNTRELNAGKLGPMWEGPYRVPAVTGKGSYELENQNG